jgi:hypothetical protein
MELTFNSINYSQLESDFPALYDVIQKSFSKLDVKEKEKIAGLVFDCVLQSGGDISIFNDDEETQFDYDDI